MYIYIYVYVCVNVDKYLKSVHGVNFEFRGSGVRRKFCSAAVEGTSLDDPNAAIGGAPYPRNSGVPRNGRKRRYKEDKEYKNSLSKKSKRSI